MPSQIAAFLCACLIIYLLWVDVMRSKDTSKAIWIPLLWMFLAGSRYVSQWLDIGSPISPFDAYHEGNPVNMAVFLGLIVAGIIVLIRRRINWGRLLIENKWIVLFFLFGAISLVWSDYPFVSLKRLIKAMGNVVMALIILTEVRPYEALGVVLRRLAFLLLPLSVLFIKYYPDLGRAYHQGMPMFTGVATHKNGLGQLCLLTGIYFSWRLLLFRREGINLGGRMHAPAVVILVVIIAWLFYMSNSATSMGCMIVAICILAVSSLPAISRRSTSILLVVTICAAILGLMETLFDVSNTLITMLGRDATLTTRVPMWHGLLEMAENPLIGFGYEIFWTSERQLITFERWYEINQAHNGYLELYLNLGLIGLFLLIAWIVSGLKNVASLLRDDYPNAILNLCLVIVIILYNWTEAALSGVSNMWILLLLGTIAAPVKRIGEQRVIKT